MLDRVASAVRSTSVDSAFMMILIKECRGALACCRTSTSRPSHRNWDRVVTRQKR